MPLRLCLTLLIVLLAAGCTDASDDASVAPDEAAPAADAPQPAASPPAPVVSENVGEPAPDFALPTLAGDTLRLSELRGQTVVLNFWATWCGPCVEEMPELQALHDDLHEQGLTVVGVSLDDAGPDAVRAFVDEMGITYPIALAADDVDQVYGGVYALPTTYLIDADGRIARRILGIVPFDDVRPLLDEMVRGS